MLLVVKLERLSAHHRLERILGVRKRRYLEIHRFVAPCGPDDCDHAPRARKSFQFRSAGCQAPSANRSIRGRASAAFRRVKSTQVSLVPATLLGHAAASVSTAPIQAAAGSRSCRQPLREPGGAPIVSARSLASAAGDCRSLVRHRGGSAARRAHRLAAARDRGLSRPGGCAYTPGPRPGGVRGERAGAALACCASFRSGGCRSAQRVHALRRLENEPAAAPLFAVKALLSLIYYEHPDAAREVGFDGECMGQSSVTLIRGRELERRLRRAAATCW